MACRLAEIVHDGVFCLVSHEFGMPEFLGKDHGIYREGGVEVEIAAPVDGLDCLIHFIGITGGEVLDGF